MFHSDRGSNYILYLFKTFLKTQHYPILKSRWLSLGQLYCWKIFNVLKKEEACGETYVCKNELSLSINTIMNFTTRLELIKHGNI